MDGWIETYGERMGAEDCVNTKTGVNQRFREVVGFVGDKLHGMSFYPLPGRCRGRGIDIPGKWRTEMTSMTSLFA